MIDSFEKKLLVTPMGASPGLIYTAVSLVKPEQVVIVSSERFKSAAFEACHKGGIQSKSQIQFITMKDVFAGFNEARTIAREVEKNFVLADKILVNLTGGTTALQWVMQVVYENAKQKNMPVERIAFVDRRPALEQHENPWQVGELIEVDRLV